MSTDKKTTADSYNKNAEKWTSYRRGGVAIFHEYLEKPAIYSKVPSLENMTVLCAGCGSGEEVNHLQSLGAKKVIGIDLSEKLIEIAKRSYPELEFRVMDIEKIEFPDNEFDFVYSSLTLHYLENWSVALKSINKVLKQNCKFVFSITHPFFSATLLKEDQEQKARIFGYKDIKNTSTCEIYGDYLNSYKLEYDWGDGFTIINYHRPLSVIIKEVINSGFEIIDIVEPQALDESKEEYKKFWEIHQRIPEFIVFELRKK